MVPLVASRSKTVAFCIVVAASGLSLKDHILYEMEHDSLRPRGFSEEEIAQAKALRKLYQEVILTGHGWEKLQAAVESAQNKRWFPAARVPSALPSPTDKAVLNRERRYLDFDPASVWEKIRCPVAVYHGELDTHSPVKESAARIERALKKAGNPDYTAQVFPKANHTIIVEPDQSGPWHWPGFATGYLNAMTNWLLKRVRLIK